MGPLPSNGCFTDILLTNVSVVVVEAKLAGFVSGKVPEMVLGDPGRFRQIITNLVGNSVKVSKSFFHILKIFI